MEILLCEGTKPFSKLIKLVTGYHATHWVGRFGGGEELWCVHSTIGGVQPDWWWSIQDRYKSMTRFRTKFICADDALAAASERLGHRQYDYGVTIGKGIYIILTRMGCNPKKNPFGNKQKYDCVEFGNEFHREVDKRQPELKIQIFDGKLLVPGQLVEYYKTRPDLFEEIHEAI